MKIFLSIILAVAIFYFASNLSLAQDEEGMDCGGPNCPPCIEYPKRFNWWLLLTILSWLLLGVLILVYLYYINNGRKQKQKNKIKIGKLKLKKIKKR